MDFAKKQLEKYGWKDGEGLGREKQGMNEAIRPKIKRSNTGLGHNIAEDHTDYWWQKVYDEAANNLEIQKSDDATPKILTKKKDVPKKIAHKKSYQDTFVKKAEYSSSGYTNTCSDSEEEKKETSDRFNILTDEQLYAACDGMTAHKGARHGLRAEGKLSRIERQEASLLLLPQYKNFSKDVQQMQEDVADEIKIKKKKKKKRKLDE